MTQEQEPIPTRFRTLLGLALGLGPGLLFPFALALYFEPAESDTVLIALSVSLLLVNVVVAASEASSISSLGARSTSVKRSDFADLRGLARRNLRASVPAVLVSYPALAVAYGVQLPDPSSFALAVGIVMAVPVLGAISASFSAALIVEGHAPIAVASQGLRSLLPLVIMCSISNVNILTIVTLYSVGEAVRLSLLASHRAISSRGSFARSGVVPVSYRAMYWQFGASASTQSNAAVDRLFLSGSGAGNVTAYDLGEKIAYGVFQFVYSAKILPILSRWSTDYAVHGAGTSKKLIRDLARLAVLTIALALTAGVLVGCALVFAPVPPAWELGLLWSLISLASMPFAVMISALMRLLVILGESRAMFTGGLLGLLVNVAFDAAFIFLFGPVGIVIAGVITRAVTALLLLLIAMRRLRNRN